MKKLSFLLARLSVGPLAPTCSQLASSPALSLVPLALVGRLNLAANEEAAATRERPFVWLLAGSLAGSLAKRAHLRPTGWHALTAK